MKIYEKREGWWNKGPHFIRIEQQMPHTARALPKGYRERRRVGGYGDVHHNLLCPSS